VPDSGAEAAVARALRVLLGSAPERERALVARYAMVYVRTLLRSRHAAWRFAFSESLNDISQQIADWEASQLLRVEEEPEPVCRRLLRRLAAAHGMRDVPEGEARDRLRSLDDALLVDRLHRVLWIRARQGAHAYWRETHRLEADLARAIRRLCRRDPGRFRIIDDPRGQFVSAGHCPRSRPRLELEKLRQLFDAGPLSLRACSILQRVDRGLVAEGIGAWRCYLIDLARAAGDAARSRYAIDRQSAERSFSPEGTGAELGLEEFRRALQAQAARITQEHGWTEPEAVRRLWCRLATEVYLRAYGLYDEELGRAGLGRLLERLLPPEERPRASWHEQRVNYLLLLLRRERGGRTRRGRRRGSNRGAEEAW